MKSVLMLLLKTYVVPQLHPCGLYHPHPLTVWRYCQLVNLDVEKTFRSQNEVIKFRFPWILMKLSIIIIIIYLDLFQFLSEVVDTVELHLCPTSSGSGYGVPQQEHPSVPSGGAGIRWIN